MLQEILGLTLEELQTQFADLGLKSFGPDKFLNGSMPSRQLVLRK